MEISDSVGGVPQVGHGFPCAIRIGPTFPVHQILQTLAFVARVNDAFNFVFLFSILRDVGGARGSHGLTREVVVIWLYTGDVDNGMNVHRAGKAEFNSICPDQLRDGIGTKPAFRQLPRSSGEMEVIGGEPDLISDGICWSIQTMLIGLHEDARMRLDQVVIGAGEAVCKFLRCWGFCHMGLCSHTRRVCASELEGRELYRAYLSIVI